MLIAATLALQASRAAPTIDTNTAVSIGIVVVLLGATWRISGVLSDIQATLRSFVGMPERVIGMEVKLENLSKQVTMLEEDLNNLWAAFRADPPDRVRRNP